MFLRLVQGLKKYINDNNSIMCSPTKIQKHMLPNIHYREAQNITQHYRLYVKGRYKLDKLVILIILYKYSTNIILENSREEKQRLHSMVNREHWFVPYKCVDAFEKFMLSY